MRKCDEAKFTRLLTPIQRGVIAVLGAVLFSLGSAQAAPLHAVHPVFSPALGDSVAYEINSSGDVDMDYVSWARTFLPRTDETQNTSSGLAKHAFSVTATLHLRPVGHEDGMWQMAGRLQNILYKVDAQQEFLSKLFEAPMLLTYRGNGQLASLKLPGGMPDEVAGVIRSLVEPLQIALPSTESESWQGRLHETQAQSVVAYRLSGSEDNGRVIRFERRLVAQSRADKALLAPQVAGVTTVVVATKGDVVWSTEDKTLLSMTADDTTENLQNGRLLTRQHMIYSAKKTTSSAPALPTTMEETLSSLKGKEIVRLSQYWVPAQLKHKISAQNLGSLIVSLEQGKSVEGLKPAAALKFYMRLKPESVQSIAAYYAALPVTKENLTLTGKAFAAIGSAGHFEAQQMLSDLVGRSSYSTSVRELALHAMLSLQTPYPFLLPVVWNYRESLPRWTADERARVAIATNIYGALGGIERFDTTMTEEVVRVLGARLRSTNDRSEKLMCLTALGNVGDLDKVLPLTEQYFSDGDTDVRRRAFHTFQKAIGDASFERFAQRYEAERNLSVRRTASDILDAMPASASRNQWVAQQITSTADPVIQARFIRVLGDNLKRFPENKATLKELLNTVADREVRKTIYRYVSPVTVMP